MLVREGGRLVEPLDATTMPHTAKAKTPPGPISEPGSLEPAQDVDLELDLDLAGNASSETTVSAIEVTRPFTTAPALADDRSFSIELPGLGQPTPAAAAASSQAGSLDFDLGELTLDDEKDAAPSRPAALTSDHDFAASLPSFELGDEEADPLARKLELAEEFRQIGDMEGARDLLEEVLASAEGALKTKAQGMLNSLS
jgi:pilus assembly protein FimV